MPFEPGALWPILPCRRCSTPRADCICIVSNRGEPLCSVSVSSERCAAVLSRSPFVISLYRLPFSLSSAYRLVKRLGFIGKALLSQQKGRRAGGSALRRFGKPFPAVPPVIRRMNRLLLQRPPYCRTIPTARPARQSQRKAHRLWSERRRQRRRAFRAALLRRRFSVCPGNAFPALRTSPEVRARFSPAF